MANFDVTVAERIPTRKMPEITDEPAIWRYFGLPFEKLLKDAQLDEREFVARCIVKINTQIKDAYVFSSGKNMIGGETGSFLGEYQAGGTIVVLGLGSAKKIPVGNLCGTGMHGGKIYLRCEALPEDLPKQVQAAPASAEDMAEIDGYLDEFCSIFNIDKQEVLSKNFYVLTPNTKNPYKSLYTFN